MDLLDCEPCKAREKQTVASHWCMDCEEQYCKECTEIHKVQKMSKCHHLIQLKEKPQGLRLSISCIEHDLSFEYFCIDHYNLCCMQCLALSHRKCNRVEALEIAALNAKDSESIVDSFRHTDHILQTLPSLLSNWERDIKDLEAKEKTLKVEITNVKRNLINRLDDLEETLFSELHQLKEAHITNMTSQICEIKQILSKTQEQKDQLKFIQQYGSDKQAFILTQSTQRLLQKTESKVLDICKMSPEIKLEFHANENKQLFSLGIVDHKIKHSCNLFTPFKHHNSQSLAIQKQLSTFLYDIEPKYIRHTAISGLTVTDNNWLVLCDVMNSQLHIYGENDAYIKSINITGSPWDVTSLPKKMKVVVTDHDRAHLTFVDLSSSQARGKVILYPMYCGISVTDDYIFVGGEKMIYLLDYNGIQRDAIRINSVIEGRIDYLTTSSNGAVIFSRFPDNGIYSVDDTGKLVFIYHSSQMKGPRKIVCDDDSNVYIIAESTENIHKLQPDGKLVKIILSKTDGLEEPWALCFNKDFSKLYVSNKKGSVITVFKVK